jgi:formylmethanofuran dehydrogenase subunit B
MQAFENVACTRCGCVCDDLTVMVDGGRVTRIEPHCALAEPWFQEQDTRQPPVAQIDGRPASLDEAVRQTAEILNASRYPLIYGLSRSSTDGQRAAIALAERVGGTIDTTASLCHATSMMAIQEVGESTCTLGEIKNRADLVIYWGSDVVETHPRHLERYSLFPRGRYIPNGRSSRTLVVADSTQKATARQADIFLAIEPECDFEALHTLRSLVLGKSVNDDRTGAPLTQLRTLAERMKACRYGIIFFGTALSMSGLGHRNIEALLMLVRDLNQFTRFFARRMRVQGDVTGADTVLTWQTGYPFGVNLSRGFPRFNPGEFTGNDMLERQDVDACLLLGSEGVSRFSGAAVDHLRNIPTIVLDHPTERPLVSPTVQFTTAVYGVHHAGTAYRMDGVPIPLHGFLSSVYPTDVEVLKRVEESID